MPALTLISHKGNMTALMLASIEGHSGVTTVLLEFHASVKSKDQVFMYLSYRFIVLCNSCTMGL